MVTIMLISNILNILNFNYISRSFASYNIKKRYVIVFMCIIICGLSMFNAINQYHLNPFIMILTYFIFSLIVYKYQTLHKLAYRIALMIYFIVSLSICELTALVFLKVFIGYSVSVNLLIINFFGVIISNLLTFIISYYIKKYCNSLKSKSLPKNSWIIICLPITTFLLIISIDDYYSITNQNTLIFLIIILGLLFSNFIFLRVYFKTIEYNHIEKERQLSDLKYETIRHMFYQQNNTLHGLRNNTKDLINYLETKEFDKMSTLLFKMYSSTLRDFNLTSSNLEILNIILNDRNQEIIDIDIQMRIKLEDVDFQTKLSSSDLVLLMSSIVDMGIESCKNCCADKYILLKSKKFNNSTLLSFSFSSTSSFYEKITSLTLHSSKKIHEICDKYDFILKIEEDILDQSINLSLLVKE